MVVVDSSMTLLLPPELLLLLPLPLLLLQIEMPAGVPRKGLQQSSVLRGVSGHRDPRPSA